MAELTPIDFLAQAIEVIRTARSSSIAINALQYYDWLLLFDQEVEFIHKGKWTLIRVLYILTRYYALLISPFEIYNHMFDHGVDTCHKISLPAYIVQFPFQCIAQLVMVYRAYAFTGYKTPILILLGSCYLTLVGIELWAFLTPPIVVPDTFYELIGKTGCFIDFEDPRMQIRMAFIMSAAVVMDLVSLLVILFRVRRMTLGRNTIPRIFIQEGMMSFAGILIVNTISGIEYFARTPRRGGGLSYVFLMSNIFACRTILHLRNAGKRTTVTSGIVTNPVVRAAVARADENAGRQPVDDWTIYTSAKRG